MRATQGEHVAGHVLVLGERRVDGTPPPEDRWTPVLGGCFECGSQVWILEADIAPAERQAHELQATIRVMCLECGGGAL